MGVQKQQYATSRNCAAGRQILNHLSDRGHIALWLGNNQHQSGSTYSRYTVFFPCEHMGMSGRLLRIFPRNPTRTEDLEMLQYAESLPWIQPGMNLVAFNAGRTTQGGIFTGELWNRVQHALDQLCGYKPEVPAARRRRRGGHNEYLYPRYALG